jgi:hypothetical protein
VIDPTNSTELEELLSQRLTRLENSVEYSTVARINGRTMNNRLIHSQALTDVMALITAAMETDRQQAAMEAKAAEWLKIAELTNLTAKRNKFVKFIYLPYDYAKQRVKDLRADMAAQAKLQGGQE